MISLAAQGRFAAEFLAFLVAAAGLALLGLRAELVSENRSSRLALASGFFAVAVASFLQGSLIVGGRDGAAMLALRAAGLVALAAGSMRWSGGSRSQRILWLGLAGMALAVLLLRVGAQNAGDAALGGAAAALGVALRLASGRSISARVAASSAAILLGVVLILSVALSAVLSTTVRDDAGKRLAARAALEADFIVTTQTAVASVVARNVALTIATNSAYQAETSALLSATNPNTGELSTSLRASFAAFQSYLAVDQALAYINESGHEYAQSGPHGFDQGVIGYAVESEGVKEAFANVGGGENSSVQAFGTQAFVVAVQRVAHVTGDQTTYPTAVVAIAPLNDNYLAIRYAADKHVSLALVGRTSVLAEAGSPGSPSELLALSRRVIDNDASIALTTAEGRLFSVRPLVAGGQPVAALVVATPGTVVTSARDDLSRTLFVLAMAGTLLALALSAYAGERLSAGIRTLTTAAQRIQRGDFAEPAGVKSEDEIGVLGAAFDSMTASISAQTRALKLAADDEAALRNQLQAVVAGMGEALIAVDGEGRVTLFNRAAEELLGQDAEDVAGRLVGDVLEAESEDGILLATRLQRPSPTRWSTTASVTSDLEPRIPVAINASALRGTDGGVVGGVLVLRDLRPEREVERVKSQFLSRIGHELRTPLTGILGYAEILLRRPVPEARARDMHQQIVDAGRRLYRVVQMLEFSAAAEAGRSLLRSEPLSMRAIVDEVVDGWDGRLNGDHVLTRRVTRRLPDVRGDRRWLAMAIDELIDNAVKFSPEGGRVAVSASVVVWGSDADRRPAVQVSVVDDGVGMTEREQQDAFADFVQADGSDTRRFGGLGLGLSLVKRVAEAHGGAVIVESTPQKGSKFSIIIPALPIDDSA